MLNFFFSRTRIKVVPRIDNWPNDLELGKSRLNQSANENVKVKAYYKESYNMLQILQRIKQQ